MSEQIHDQVSAFMDDELSAEECAFLVRRFERDPDASEKLVRYSLIGSVLKGDLLQPDPHLLRRRLHEALNGDSVSMRGGTAPAVAGVAHAHRGRAGERWANPAVGLGIAASVAVAALFTIRAVNEVDGVEPTPASSTASTVVVPDGGESTPMSSPLPIRLTNYLLHHSEYAHRLSRTSVHSSVVGGTDVPSSSDDVVAEDASGERRGTR